MNTPTPTNTCRQCGGPMAGNAPEGLCARCLLSVALKEPDPGMEPTVEAGFAEAGSVLTINPAAFVRVRYVGDYELQQEIARGGMGVVWKARQASLNRTVALKMILAGKLAGEAEVQRFRREAEAAANLQHPNIVAIHEVGEHEGQHYYSMDYVEGRDLGALVRESGPLAPARAAECLKTIAEAVHFAHQRGTLHRDLKPQNVLMDAAGVPRVTDFGLAKFIEGDDSLTQTGAAMGSPSYMPPERAAGRLDQVGPHSDVYSLGAILYELLTGRPPFRAGTAMATMREVMESNPVGPRKLNPAVPPDLETICLKCLEKSPQRRYPTARDLAEDLGRFLKSEPIQALPVSVIRKAESWLRQHPWTLMAAGSLAIMVLTGMLDWQFERVKFLERRPLLTDEALLDLGLRPQLLIWTAFYTLGVIIMIGAFTAIQLYAQGRMDWNRLFDWKRLLEPRTGWAPAQPMSQRMRVVCGLMSVVALGFTALYFAKTIQVGVWYSGRLGSPVALFGNFYLIFLGFIFSLRLLSQVARDYQKFIHGMPSRTLSAEQNESLRQMIRDGGVNDAIKLYRQTFRDVSQAEACDFIAQFTRDGDIFGEVKLYRQSFPGASVEEALGAAKKRAAEYTAELRAKHPEKFPRRRPLHGRAMAICLAFHFAVFAGFWAMVMFMMPFEGPAATMLSFAEGFLFGAGATLSMLLMTSWKRFLGVTLCLALAILAAWVSPMGASWWGVAFGALLGHSFSSRMFGASFAVIRPTSAPGNRPPTDVSPPL